MFELEVLDGLVPVCAQEVRALVGRQATLYDSSHPDQLAFEFSGRASRLTKLRTAVAVFKLLYFKVPHPLPIVQGQNLERLITEIEAIRDGARFTSFRIGAAGSDSTAFRRIKSVIAQRTGLVNDEEEGEMSIRFRRSRRNSFGWDVLIRLTPRPLSARTWRIENMPGALNATIAAAMVFQTAPQPSDRFLNLMCGSGTILAERAAICPAERLIGVDVAGSALKSSRANLAHLQTPPMLLQEEIGQLSLSDASVDVICVDLPWGRLIGKQSELGGVYNETMRQASRVCMPGGRFAILTQEIETFESALNPFKRYWDVIAGFRVKQSDYRPKFFLLQRNDRAFSRA
jgi:precorrin-6B methylase 2